MFLFRRLSPVDNPLPHPCSQEKQVGWERFRSHLTEGENETQGTSKGQLQKSRPTGLGFLTVLEVRMGGPVPRRAPIGRKSCSPFVLLLALASPPPPAAPATSVSRQDPQRFSKETLQGWKPNATELAAASGHIQLTHTRTHSCTHTHRQHTRLRRPPSCPLKVMSNIKRCPQNCPVPEKATETQGDVH